VRVRIRLIRRQRFLEVLLGQPKVESIDRSASVEKLLQGEQLWNWLRSHRDRNTFVYLHIVDPHGPYEPPAPFDEAYRTLEPGSGPVVQRVDSLDADYVQQPTAATRAALYDGEIRNNDDKLRGFFDRMKAEGLFDDTLFIFTADHGEYLGEHGYFAHNPPGYVQNTGVPLIVYHKQKIPQQLRVDEPVQLLDIMPTVLDFANVDTSGMVMQGDSLLGLIEGRDRGYWKSRVIASEEVTTRDRARSWRNTGLRVCGSLFYGDWHFISSRSFWPHSGFVPESLRLKVFNQAEDPQETQALSRFFADAYLRYRFTAGLDELQSLGEDAQRRFRSTQEINYEFDPDTLEHLKALGYVE